MALANTTRPGAEDELREAIMTGRLVHWRTGDASVDDPAHGAGWDAQRTVAAAMLAELLTEVEWPRRPRALRLAGARIVGQLDLEAAELACPLLLRGCWFAEPLILDEAKAPALRLPGCHLPGLFADQLTIRGNLALNNDLNITGEVRLDGAYIGGNLELDGATLTNPNGRALTADRITINQHMLCRNGFTATGEIKLLGGHIGGRLDFGRATLTNPNGRALTADRITINQDMFCRKGFSATGEVRLAGAHIGGNLEFGAASLTNPNGCALHADTLSVAQDMFCGEGFTARGEIRLLGAHIDGQLDFIGGTLTNADGYALSADGLTVGHSMLCREGFSATGEVRLAGAQIGGNLEFDGATLTNADGYALNADELTVGHSMFCQEGFSATGEVWLAGAHIGRLLSFNGATLTNPDKRALSADQLTVDDNLFLGKGFTANGQINLRGAHIGGQFGFDGGATLTIPDGRALDLQELRAGSVFLRDLTKPPALVLLTHAQVGVMVDEPASWPRQVHLDGFVYDALYEHRPVRVDQRLGWLARNPHGYSPQPYEQLAAVYRRAGRDQDARTVAIAKQRARRRILGLPGRLWSLLLDGLVGYGYRTWLAGAWLLAFWLVGWAVFDRAHAYQDLVLAKPAEAHPNFHAAIYSLDTLLPVVDLGQQAVWIPRHGVQWWAWASVLAGWVLTTAVVAALTGLLKRD